MSRLGNIRPRGFYAVTLALSGLLGCQPPPIPELPEQPEPEVHVVDPAAVTDGDVTVAYENGLRILVKRIPGAELAALQLYIKGGARFRDKDSAGTELLALRAAVTGGTAELDKDSFSRQLVALGSDLGAASKQGYSLIAAKSLTEQIDETFALMAAAFLSPALPVSVIEQQRQQLLVMIKRREVDPDSRLALLTHRAMYTGHPYEQLPSGTEESVSAVTRQQLFEHLASLRVTSRLELVVAGDVAADHVRELVRGTLAQLPRGDYDPTPLPEPVFNKAKLHAVDAELPTSYIEASFVGPRWQDPDFAAAIVAMKILAKRVFDEVRTKRNLSYAPKARLSWGGEITRGSLYVTTVDPNTAIEVMYNEVLALQREPVEAAVLAGVKAQYLTGHLMANESTDGQASLLAVCDLSGGDWQLSRELLQQIDKVTAADILRFAQRYIRHLQAVALGNPARFDRALFESL